MDHRTHRASRPARRTRGVLLVTLVSLGVAGGVFLVQRPAATLTPSGASDGGARPAMDRGDPPVRTPTPTPTRTVLDERDGVISEHASVSVFDDGLPAVNRLDPNLLDAVRRAAMDAQATGIRFRVNSGWRSAAYQRRLWRNALDEYGSAEEAAKWVATPDTSAHVTGEAVDLGPSGATAWLSEHGAAYGLCQTYGNEPWHYELRPDAATLGCPPMYANSSEDPRMRS